MKKLTQAVLALTIVASAISSCKKGDGDPAISLRSRASRVAGEWNVTSMDSKSSYSNTISSNTTSTTSSTETEKFTDVSYSLSGTEVDYNNQTVSRNVTGTVTSNTFTFEKDGTWKRTLTYTTKETRTENDFFGTIKNDISTDYTINEEGKWNFLGSVNPDTKNKEEMMVYTTKANNVTKETTVTTYTPTGGSAQTPTTITRTTTETTTDDSGDNNSSVWKITTLKNKEMAIEFAGKSTRNTQTTSTAVNSVNTTNNSTGDYSGSMTLEAK